MTPTTNATVRRDRHARKHPSAPHRPCRQRAWTTAIAAAWMFAFAAPTLIRAEDSQTQGAPVKGSAIVADKNLAGTWNLVRSVNEGKAVPKSEIKGTEVIVRENEISVVDSDDQERYRAVYDLDRSTEPATITMRSTLVPGEKEGSVSLGIYQVEGDTWTLAYALPGHPRPEELKSTPSNRALLMVMKRPKPMRKKSDSETSR